MFSQVLTKEYYTMQTSLEKRNSELESSLQELKSKLETYEKLELELDEVIMQAADSKWFVEENWYNGLADQANWLCQFSHDKIKLQFTLHFLVAPAESRSVLVFSLQCVSWFACLLACGQVMSNYVTSSLA